MACTCKPRPHGIPKALTWEQQRLAVDRMITYGHPFDVAVAVVLGIWICPHGNSALFLLGEKALKEAARRGYVKEGKRT
jgi:hypothetical protein